MLTKTTQFNGSTFKTYSFATFADMVEAAAARKGRVCRFEASEISVVSHAYGKTTHHIFTVVGTN